MNTWMYFELNGHPAQVPRTKIEFWGGLISDLEHCALVGGEVSKNWSKLLTDCTKKTVDIGERVSKSLLIDSPLHSAPDH